jgi:hypothetical protein
LCTDARRPKLTDDQVAQILLATGPISAIAVRFSASSSAISSIRRLESFRAIRIAEGLGILRPGPERKIWAAARNTRVDTVGKSALRRA